MTERDIQIAIWWAWGKAGHCCMPNYTPRDWWECDVFCVSKAGYFTEYEIKLTAQDFRADAQKQATRLANGQRVNRGWAPPFALTTKQARPASARRSTGPQALLLRHALGSG